MTETGQATDVTQSSGVIDSSPAPTSVETPTQEKMLSQSEVNELVGKVKHSAYEKGRKEAAVSYQPQQTVTPQQAQTTFGGIPQVPEEQLAKIIDQRLNNFTEQAERRAAEAEAKRQVEEITSSLANKCLSVPDFEQKMQGFEWKAISPLMPSLANKDNPGEILLELKANPQKIVTILGLAHTMPALAEQQLQQLSDSIRENQLAAKAPSAKEPLSQIKPSITGNDSGSRTVSDLRKHPKFRV